MKVIIPVAGIGSRLRPHTHTQPKALVPVAGKPILAHIVDNLIRAGVKEFIFIVGYLGDKVEEYIRSQYSTVENQFIVQEPRQGIGHAVWLARDYVKGESNILVVLGDTVFDADLSEVMQAKESAIGVKKVDDPRSFGVVETDKKGYIVSVVEKPAIPKSNLAVVGLYYFTEPQKLMDALGENIGKNMRTHNEFHLTDGIRRLMEAGEKIKTFEVDNWYDCGNKDSLLETNAILLKKNASEDVASRYFENTIIIPPVSIAGSCKISNSIIGPHVSIGENTIINHSILKDAIIGSYSQIENAVLHHSVIGSDASLLGSSQSLNLGDNTEIDFR